MGYNNSQSSAIYSYFLALSYITPLIGGYLSDAYLGYFKTIVPFSMVYIAGMVLLSISTYINSPAVTAFIGLFLIGVGTGGIKPCVSSFGCSQIESDNPNAITTYFNLFYFSINFGSLFGVVTPFIKDIGGEDSNYGASFILTAVLLCVATIVIIIGYKSYIHNIPQGSVLVKVFKIVWYSINRKRKATPFEKEELLRMKEADITQKTESIYDTQSQSRSQADSAISTNTKEQNDTDVTTNTITNKEPIKLNLIDYARFKYTTKEVYDTLQVLSALPVFASLPQFWAVYDQQGSTWTLQAKIMNPTIFGQTFSPESMQFVNAALILIFVPTFETLVYPLCRKMGINLHPQGRMYTGYFLTAYSYLAAALLQLTIDNSAEKSVNIFWQIPQYVLISAAEILVSTTGLEYSYAIAPDDMKSIVSSVFSLTVSVGDLQAGALLGNLTLPAEASFWLFALLISLNFIAFTFIFRLTRTLSIRMLLLYIPMIVMIVVSILGTAQKI